MSDCGNAALRDQLPEFVHGRLSASNRAIIESHLAVCDDCIAEVELLRTVQRTWAPADASAPDVAAIVRALPSPPARSARHESAAQKRPARRFAATRWQLAAAALVVVAGALAMSVVSRVNRGNGQSELLIVARSGSENQPVPAGSERAPATFDSAVPGDSDSPRVPSVAASTDSVLLATAGVAEATISFGAGIDELESSELEALLQAIDQIDGRPVAEPATLAPIPIESGEGANE